MDPLLKKLYEMSPEEAGECEKHLMIGAAWVSTRAMGKYIGGARFNRISKQFIRVPNPYCYRCPLGLERENCGMMCLKILRLIASGEPTGL